MREQHEAELRLALAEGIIDRHEEPDLRARAQRLHRNPLDLLVEQGRVSEQTGADLRDALHDSSAGPDPGFTGASTFHDTPATGARAPQTGFPAAWDRYTYVELLGEGGMGRVFQAHDPRLRRHVAIKLMRSDAPDLVRRFLTEARAQARVDHEHVCKVYEVGEVAGRAYIAMQHVPGASLDELAGELTLEHKVMILRDVAEGVHAAHRVGVIHRDIKPSNILVERTADGRCKPYVADFGLARDWQEGITMTGAVLGTPGYMAPEQARGETARLDRRVDVYALGATLYRLLTGERPIPGQNALEILGNIATVEPRPPRALDPDIPADLEAIVLQCLEKQRADRYDSARAVAEDLGRFLDGEPVLARRAGRWYRLRKRARKHRRGVALALAALLAVSLALAWAGLARRQAAERERLARRFTEQVERIEAMARYASLAPLHDTRADREATEARMLALEAEVRRAGPAAAGPGHYALGRGAWALGDEPAARAHLETAWQLGYREPRVAYALALVMGRLYHEGLIDAQRLAAPGRREARRQELERRYRDPALAYLRASQGAAVPSAGYVDALLAYYEGRLDQALARLDAVRERLPWFHEAPKLEGDILAARAGARWHRGDRDGALADFARGRRAYDAAAEIGESDPAVYVARAELEYAALRMAFYGQGDPAPHIERGIEAVSRALAAAPGHYEALVLEARLQRWLAEHRAGQPGAAGPPLAAALAAARAARDLAPDRAEAWLELGLVWRQMARQARLRGQEPRPHIERALGAFASVRSDRRDHEHYLNLGATWTLAAEDAAQRGADARTPRGRAIAAYQQAIALDPGPPEAWMNLGAAYFQRASHPRAPDAAGDLQRAMAALDEARERNPEHLVPYFYAARAHELLARRQRNRGGDPGPALERAIALYRAGIAVNDRVAPLHNGLGGALVLQAEAAWDRGQAPWSLLDQALAAYRQAIAVAPGQAFGYNNAGAVAVFRARYERALGRDPGASLAAAEAAYRQALERMPEQPIFLANLAEAYALRAAHEIDAGRDPGASLALGTEAAGAALARNPEAASGWRYRGELEAEQARWQVVQGAAVSHARLAGVARRFERAIELAPDEPGHRVALGRFLRWWARWRAGAGTGPGASDDVEQVVVRGLARLDEALAMWPGHAEALALRGDLLGLRAERAAPGDERARAWLARALDDVRAALAANAHLARAWAPAQQRLERLLATGY